MNSRMDKIKAHLLWLQETFQEDYQDYNYERPSGDIVYLLERMEKMEKALNQYAYGKYQYGRLIINETEDFDRINFNYGALAREALELTEKLK